jgi:hypothetical protein
MLRLNKHWLILLLFLAPGAFTQDKIYIGSSSVECRIIDINSSVVSYITEGSSQNRTSIPLDRALIAFNKRGDYVIPANLNFSELQTQHQINYFLDSTKQPIAIDRIFTTDSRKMEGNIEREDNRFIYLSGDRIAKRSIIAVIYRNGKHELFTPASKALPVLAPFITQIDETTGNDRSGLSNDGDSSAAKDSSSLAARDESGNTSSTAFKELAGKVTREEFVEKSKQKTLKLNEYLKLICTKSADYEEITKAIDQAVKLFVDENAVVETSSLNRTEVRRHKIRNYLTHIKVVQYDKIEIEWTAVQFVSEITKGPDGNYHGVVSFEQVFRGYRDGRLVYQDITRKHANVVLKEMERHFEGSTTTVWDVLLSDIGVISTKSGD